MSQKIESVVIGKNSTQYNIQKMTSTQGLELHAALVKFFGNNLPALFDDALAIPFLYSTMKDSGFNNFLKSLIESTLVTQKKVEEGVEIPSIVKLDSFSVDDLMDVYELAIKIIHINLKNFFLAFKEKESLLAATLQKPTDS